MRRKHETPEGLPGRSIFRGSLNAQPGGQNGANNARTALAPQDLAARFVARRHHVPEHLARLIATAAGLGGAA